MTFGSLVRGSLALALAGLAGCIITPDPREEEYAVFKSRSGGYLRVSLDRNRYEANDEPPTATARGLLSADEYEQVEALTSDERMEHYVETSAADREACLADPAAFSLSTRKSLGGCWLPDDVDDADTREMLDFMVPLLAQYAPSGPGGGGDGEEEEQKTDARVRDASARDGGRDAGARDR
jgi:hypothetical protein